ncbi:MAG: ribosome maturation factor RimP [Acidimicrobiia bacterium]|nr:MAG: ribosome maturation factor RimP [Acidimicrobiia bacterium]
MASVQDRLWDRIDPYVAAEGIELDDIEILGGGQIVRVTVDAGDPIGVDLIAELSAGIGRLIEEDDPLPGSYVLEVSSPGLERKLTRFNHYRKSIGRVIKVKTFAAIDGDKSHQGALVAADEQGFTIDIDGTERKLRYRDVSSARTVFVWEKGARPGKDA